MTKVFIYTMLTLLSITNVVQTYLINDLSKEISQQRLVSCEFENKIEKLIEERSDK